MYYDGVIGYKFNEMYTDPTVYQDTARRVVSLTSESANGMCRDGSVVVYYAIKDDLPMIICERVLSKMVNLNDINTKVIKFNEKKFGGMHATVQYSEDELYYDIVVSRIDMYNAIKEM